MLNAFVQMQRENNCGFFEKALQSLVFVHCFSTKSHYFLLDSTIHSLGSINAHSCENRDSIVEIGRLVWHLIFCFVFSFDYLNYLCGRHTSTRSFLESCGFFQEGRVLNVGTNSATHHFLGIFRSLSTI